MTTVVIQPTSKVWGLVSGAAGVDSCVLLMVADSRSLQTAHGFTLRCSVGLRGLFLCASYWNRHRVSALLLRFLKRARRP